jgi:hypothetical protein
MEINKQMNNREEKEVMKIREQRNTNKNKGTQREKIKKEENWKIENTILKRRVKKK